MTYVAPEWMQRALCAIEYGPLFDKILAPVEQQAVCARCPVQADCLEVGLREETAQISGSVSDSTPIWGGLTLAQRRHRLKGERLALAMEQAHAQAVAS